MFVLLMLFAALTILAALLCAWVMFVDRPRMPVTSWRHWVAVLVDAPILAAWIVVRALAMVAQRAADALQDFGDRLTDRIVPSFDP